MPLTREQRIRLGLPPEPPPAYERLELEHRQRSREARRRTGVQIALTSTALTVILWIPLWLLAPTSAVVLTLSVGPFIGHLVARWWIGRGEERP